MLHFFIYRLAHGSSRETDNSVLSKTRSLFYEIALVNLASLDSLAWHIIIYYYMGMELIASRLFSYT